MMRPRRLQVSLPTDSPVSPKLSSAVAFTSPKGTVSPVCSHHRILSEPVLSPVALSKGWKLLYDLYPQKRRPEGEKRLELPVKLQLEEKGMLKSKRFSVLLKRSCKKAEGGDVLGHLQRLFQGELHINAAEKDAKVSDIEKFESQKRRIKRNPRLQQGALSESSASGLFPPLYSPTKGLFPAVSSPKLHS